MTKKSTLTLWRPTGIDEHNLLVSSEMRRWPPRLDHQPFFYPVLNRDYAAQIAQEWNSKTSEQVGIVTEFDIDSEYAKRFERQIVGGREHEELWVPAEQLDEFNDHIIGPIRIVDVFYGQGYEGEPIVLRNEMSS